MQPFDQQAFMSHLYEGVYIVDKKRKIVFWNSGSEQITGYMADEVINSHCYHNILKHVDKAGNQLCLNGCPLQDTLDTGKINENEVFLEHKLGYRIPVQVKTMPLYDGSGHIYAAVEVFTDMRFNQTQYHQNKKLMKIIHTDELTSLYNRKYLDFQLNQLVEESKTFNTSFGLLFIDIDHFKNVNDQYGHNVGDGVLKVISNTIKSNVRPGDVVGRWGGEEFIAIIKTDDLEQLHEVAERIRLLCASSTFKDQKIELNVTISLGGSIYKSQENLKDLIHKVDQLMYESKKQGRNRSTIKS